jgi:hypothetical protein
LEFLVAVKRWLHRPPQLGEKTVGGGGILVLGLQYNSWTRCTKNLSYIWLSKFFAPKERGGKKTKRQDKGDLKGKEKCCAPDL